jgi:lipoprotein NlpI/V8-like Glu-specific endopeptidase
MSKVCHPQEGRSRAEYRRSWTFHLACALVWLCLGIAAAGSIAGAGAVGFGSDDRVDRTREKGTPYGAIGLVAYDDGVNGRLGAGFLVAPCYIMTAHHVIGDKSGKLKPSDTASFYVGEGRVGPQFSGSQHFAEGTVAHPVVWGDYTDGESDNVSTRVKAWKFNGWQDWVLMKLDKCFGDPAEGYGYLRLMPIATRELARQGVALSAAEVGLPMDHSEAKLTEDPSCRVLGQVYSSGWQNDCMTMPGNSGGPVLLTPPRHADSRDRADWPKVLGIAVSAQGLEGMDDEESNLTVLPADDPSYFALLNDAVPVSAFINKIAQYLPADPEVSRYVAQHPIDTGYSAADSIDDAAAIADLDRAIAAHPENAELLLLRGLWKDDDDRIDGAIADYDAALKLRPGYPAALLARSNILARRNDHGKDDLGAAISDLNDLVKRFPKSAEVLRQRAELYRRDHRFDKMIADLDRVLKLRPKSSAAYMARADAHAELHQFDAAAADYNKVVQLRPELPSSYVARGNFRAQIGQDSGALADFDHAIAIYPRESDAFSGRAYVLLRQGDIKGALAAFDRSLSFDDNDAYVLGGRATLYQITGDDELAIRDYSRAVALEPGEPYTPLLLNIAKARAGKLDQAKAGFASLAESNRYDEWPHALAQFFAGEIDAPALEKLANSAISDYERKARAFDLDFYVGQALLLKGDTQEAKRRFAAVVATGDRQYLEYNIAAADLAKLGGAPIAQQ